jgi:uncharacterized membrane protein
MSTLLFSIEEQKEIVLAIREAEKNTSGEIKVHVEKFCKSKDSLVRSQEIFKKLDLHKTALRNAVLFYLATEDRKFAIWGDEGINNVVPEGFWDIISTKMRGFFVEKRFTEGMTLGIRMAGDALKQYFPYQMDDVNEISDDISFGEE